MPLDETGGRPGRRPSKNVLGGPLDICSIKPMTGFFRNGCCDTSPEDVGSHTVCAVMTKEFLAFSKKTGNDLSTPMPEYGFAGLKAGDLLIGDPQRRAQPQELETRRLLEAHVDPLDGRFGTGREPGEQQLLDGLHQLIA